MTRPKKETVTRQIGANVPPEVAARIKDYAARLHVSESWVIGRLLERGLKEAEREGFRITPPPRGDNRRQRKWPACQSSEYD